MGLAVGISFFVLIGLFVIDELNYDKFNEKKDRIYRLILDAKVGEQEVLTSTTPAPMAGVFTDEIPEIVDAVRMLNWNEVAIKYEDKIFNEDHFVLADSSFFNIFSIPFVQGNPQSALNKPHTLVITESAAVKYFGKENPMGKSLRVGTDTTYYFVTGICKDVPDNSHFEFNMLGSFLTHGRAQEKTWLSNSFSTYVLLTSGANTQFVEEKIKSVLYKYIGPEVEQYMGVPIDKFLESGGRYGILLQPLIDIHLNPEVQNQFKASNDKKYVYIFTIVAIVILIIAGINYMNLSTARSSSRAREVGLRKVVGSSKGMLIFQFLVESIILSLSSLFIAILLVELLLPYFNNLVRLNLYLDYFENWYVIPLLLCISLTLGVVSGSYPAFYLASFRPIAVLSGRLKSGIKSRILRRVLVVFQLAISITIIVVTIVISRQVAHMLNKDLGFNKEHLMVLKQAHVLQDKIPVFKKEIEKIPGVLTCSHSTSVPGHPNNVNGYQIEGLNTEDLYLLTTSWTDHDHLKTFGFELAEGRYFSEKMASDSFACIINEKAVEQFGLKDPLTTRFIQPKLMTLELTYYQVVGVVNDFHYESLHGNINPHIFLASGNQTNWGYFAIRLAPETIKQTINQVEKVWKDFTSNYPINYFFLDKDFESLYQEDKRTGRLSLIFGILAIFIASLGLFGLTSFTVEQRTKEIGIRKVHGANRDNILYLLSKEIAMLIGISTLISWPIAYIFLKNWLENYTYRINLSPLDFIFSMVIALLITWLTISYRSVKATKINPTDALRYE